jgi:hypothetical protein
MLDRGDHPIEVQTEKPIDTIVITQAPNKLQRRQSELNLQSPYLIPIDKSGRHGPVASCKGRFEIRIRHARLESSVEMPQSN